MISLYLARHRSWLCAKSRLVLGEVYVHVEHDDCPFVIQTAHGKAVITGTTFDVRTTNDGMTLVVAQGRVRLHSDGGFVHVLAGQQSRVVTISAPPSAPLACDAIALTAWARPADQGRQIVQDLRPDDFPLHDLPTMSPPWTEVQIDPDRINYTQWIEQKRGWSRQQFPWIFDLKDALGREGVEVDYPALLIRSGDIWRFAYPPAGLGRQVEPDPNGLLRVVQSYGRDGAWLQQRALSSVRATSQGPQTTELEGFERWVSALAAQPYQRAPKVDPGLLLDTMSTCLYLANTRTLAILLIRSGLESAAAQVGDEVLGLLQAELGPLARCAELSSRLYSAKPDASTCESLGELPTLIGEIRRVVELEKTVKEYEKAPRQ